MPWSRRDFFTAMKVNEEGEGVCPSHQQLSGLLWNYNWVWVIHRNVPSSPASPSTFAWWFNNRCHVKRAVKALPECLCQQQRPGWSVQPAHHAGKKRANEEKKQSLRSPNDARWEPSSARFCWAALPTPTPDLFLAAPGLWFSDTAILGFSAWWGPSSCLQHKKKRHNNQIVK